MAYTLEEFCADSHELLKSQPLAARAAADRRTADAALGQSGLRGRDFQRRHAARQARAVSRSRARFLRAGARAGRRQDRQAAQPRHLMGDLRQRQKRHRDDRVAPRQSGERRSCGTGGVEQIRARSRQDPGLWSGRDPLHRAYRQGLGDPRHRHRPRQAAALPLPQAGQDFGEV